jgi:hypothetical protein
MNILSYPPIVICAVSFSGTGYNEMYKNSSQAYDPTTMTFSDNGTPPANSVGWLLPGYIQTWHSIMPPAIPQGEIAERDPVCFNGNTTRNVSVLAYLPPTQSPPANLRVVGNVVATTPFGTQVMCQANPFSPGSFALLQANMTGPIPTGVQNLTQTFQWYYDFNAPNPTAPNLQANTTNHQLFVTLSSPQGPAITPQYPPVGGVPVIPGTVTAKRMDWATSTAWNAIQSFSVDGVTYCPGGYPQGATTITTAAEKFMYAIARSPSWRATGRVMTNSIAPWPFLDRKQPGDCVTLATLASAGLNMVGVPAGPCRAFPTADGSGTRDGSGNLIGNANVLSIAAKSGTPSCTSVTTTTFNFNGVAGFKARLQYRGGNEFEGFFTVQDPTGHTKAYTVYAPNSPGPSVPPFDNQDYYFLQVLTSAALPDNQYWVWDGSQKIGGFQVFDGTSVPTGFLDAVIPRALTIPVPPIPTTPNL